MREFIIEGYPRAYGQKVVRELIRCKDCKHYDKGTIFPCGIADDFIVGDDDYCSSAERREE